VRELMHSIGSSINPRGRFCSRSLLQVEMEWPSPPPVPQPNNFHFGFWGFLANDILINLHNREALMAQLLCMRLFDYVIFTLRVRIQPLVYVFFVLSAVIGISTDF
jgi:hypothetical protein